MAFCFPNLLYTLSLPVINYKFGISALNQLTVACFLIHINVQFVIIQVFLTTQ